MSLLSLSQNHELNVLMLDISIPWRNWECTRKSQAVSSSCSYTGSLGDYLYLSLAHVHLEMPLKSISDFQRPPHPQSTFAYFLANVLYSSLNYFKSFLFSINGSYWLKNLPFKYSFEHSTGLFMVPCTVSFFLTGPLIHTPLSWCLILDSYSQCAVREVGGKCGAVFSSTIL